MLAANSAIEEADRRGCEAGLDRNLDGRISARSNLGKEIRRITEQNEAVLYMHKDRFNHYRELPRARWTSFAEVFSREHACFVGLVAWAIMASVLAVMVLVASPEDATMPLYGSGLVAALVAGAAWSIDRELAKQRARNITPFPPLVTIENAHAY